MCFPSLLGDVTEIQGPFNCTDLSSTCLSSPSKFHFSISISGFHQCMLVHVPRNLAWWNMAYGLWSVFIVQSATTAATIQWSKGTTTDFDRGKLLQCTAVFISDWCTGFQRICSNNSHCCKYMVARRDLQGFSFLTSPTKKQEKENKFPKEKKRLVILEVTRDLQTLCFRCQNYFQWPW